MGYYNYVLRKLASFNRINDVQYNKKYHNVRKMYGDTAGGGERGATYIGEMSAAVGSAPAQTPPSLVIFRAKFDSLCVHSVRIETRYTDSA